MIAVPVCVGFLLNGFAVAEEKSTDAIVSDHMVAEAMLTAHFIVAALKAGMSTDDINAVLAKVAAQTVISEFWISDETGRIVFSDIQGAPSAEFLSGDKTVVVQGVEPRELDAAPRRTH